MSIQRFALPAFAAAFLALFAIVAIAEGIGQPGLPPDGVLRVEGVPGDVGEISQAEFDRAFAQTAAAKYQGARKPPRPGETGYRGLIKRTLEILVDRAWVLGQAEEMGISASPGEISAEVGRQREDFADEAEYREFLNSRYLTPADVARQVEVEILTVKLEEAVADVPPPSADQVEVYYEAAKSTEFTQGEELSDVEAEIGSQLEQRAQQEAFEEFAADYTATWQPRTHCAEGYVITQCADSGSGHPPMAPPGCYEANPSGGPPEACPAPVPQSAPALPGSVDPLEPRGEPLPQRPRPAGGSLPG